jgi:hypothetical protein
MTRVNFSGHLVNALTGRFANDNGRTDVPALDWVIVGGETDQKTEEGVHLARPADPAWYRSLRDQCAAAGVPFHFKQWGEWQPVRDGRPVQDGDHIRVDDAKQQARVLRRYGKANDPRTLDGVRHDARPQLAA